MASSSEPLALIAGSSQMPGVVAREARDLGRRVTALAIRGITDDGLGEVVDDIHWLEWGDVGKFLELLGELRGAGISEAVMAGKVEQRRIYDDGATSHLGPLLAALPVRHTDALIQTVANLLSGAGIKLLASSDFLTRYLAEAGTLTRRRPDERESADVEHGWKVAKTLGGLDIGQSVVVKQRAVVAIEAMEGTDACIRRAGALAGPGCVVVKVAKPAQDLRFDLPVVGLGTVEAMVHAGASALALEAGKTVVFDRRALVQAADAAELTIVAQLEKADAAEHA